MNCTGYPTEYDETYFEGCNYPILINKQKRFSKGMIKTCTGKKFPVHLSPLVNEGALIGDYVTIKKSKVTGEWIAVDYFINMEVYGAIHNERQDELPEHERTYIFNQEGELYE